MNKSKWRDNSQTGFLSGSELRLGKFIIKVHRHPSHASDLYFLSCANVFISMKRLKSKDLELAKLEAVKILSGVFEKVVDGLAVEIGINEEMMGVG